jgi:membrane protein implicated in regulation of membrane protease activity
MSSWATRSRHRRRLEISRSRPSQNGGVIFLTGIALALFVVPEAWRIPVVAGFAILEVVETAVTWQISRRGAPKVGPETLIGAIGRVVKNCRPDGSVRVRGEIWLARCESGASVGQRVRVVGRERLTLLLEPIDAHPAGESGGAAGR